MSNSPNDCFITKRCLIKRIQRILLHLVSNKQSVGCEQALPSSHRSEDLGNIVCFASSGRIPARKRQAQAFHCQTTGKNPSVCFDPHSKIQPQLTTSSLCSRASPCSWLLSLSRRLCRSSSQFINSSWPSSPSSLSPPTLWQASSPTAPAPKARKLSRALIQGTRKT